VKTAQRKLTLRVPPDLVREAKALAAKRHVSLSAWIREALARRLQFDRDSIAAGEKILRASKKRLCKLPRKRWKRDDLYDL